MGGRQRNEGYYGGVGSKPAPKVWTPPVHEVGAPPEPVPKKFRRLRLFRTRRSRMEPTPSYVLAPVLIVAGFFALLVIFMLLS